MKRLLVATLIVALIVVGTPVIGDSQVDYISPESIVADGNMVYVADFTGKDIKIINNGVLSEVIELLGEPTGLALDGEKIYATIGGPNGQLAVINKATKAVEYIPTNGHTPLSPVISGTTAYVPNRFSNSVTVINLTTKSITSIISVSREPIAAVKVGGSLYVASHLPAQKANTSVGEAIASDLTIISTDSNTVTKTLPLNNGTIDIKGIASDGEYVYIPHVLARYMLPTSQLDRGWINTNALTIVNASTNEVVNTVVLDDVDWGAANPWGAACEGNNIIVSHSGTHEITVIDKAEMFNRIDAVKNGTLVKKGLLESEADIPNDISFMYRAKSRIKLGGNGARGVSVSNGNVYVAQYFTGDVAKVNLSDKRVTTISLGSQPVADRIRKGEIYWNDGTQCYQQWESCVSCHPDGRADGLNWDNLNDGLGNPKQTKSMLYSHMTPPVMLTGIRANAETAVRAGMKFIQFNVLPEEDLTCIDEYLKSLKPVASPYLVNGNYSEKALRGKALYDDSSKGNCATCHPSMNGLYTDMKLHNVGTNSEPTMYNNRSFDTPTLVEIWRTGPYFSDGRAATMTEALTTATDSPAHNMKVTSSKRLQPLTDEEISDLVEYVMSISTIDESIRSAYMISDIAREGGTVTSVTVEKISDYTGKAQLIVGTYSGGMMLNAKRIDLDQSMAKGAPQVVNVGLSAADGTEVKAFIWDGLDTINPLSGVLKKN